MIPIPIASNMHEEDGNCDSNMLIGSTENTDCFAIKLHLSQEHTSIEIK